MKHQIVEGINDKDEIVFVPQFRRCWGCRWYHYYPDRLSDAPGAVNFATLELAQEFINQQVKVDEMKKGLKTYTLPWDVYGHPKLPEDKE